jgi:hypothetical protein
MPGAVRAASRLLVLLAADRRAVSRGCLPLVDLPEEVRIAELTREQILIRTRDEIPRSVEVEIEEIEALEGRKSSYQDQLLPVMPTPVGKRRGAIGTGGAAPRFSAAMTCSAGLPSGL